jgi:putative transposase
LTTYRAKTESWHGEIGQNLGGAKVIKSSEGQFMNRELNGARGIFLRALLDRLWLNQHLVV